MVIDKHDPFMWLASEFKEGEEYQRYANRIKGNLNCYFAGRGCHEAEDLTSETLLRIVRKLGEGDFMETQSSNSRNHYLFGIARRVLFEWQRRPARRERELQDEEEFRGLPPIDLAAKHCLELLREVV